MKALGDGGGIYEVAAAQAAGQVLVDVAQQDRRRRHWRRRRRHFVVHQNPISYRPDSMIIMLSVVDGGSTCWPRETFAQLLAICSINTTTSQFTFQLPYNDWFVPANKLNSIIKYSCS